jgi:MFS family permease
VVSNLGDGVGVVAYPWLASAVTRSPLLIALVAAASRLPWLVFTLPAGVITDRVDRRRAMVAMDLVRGAITVVVAVVVLGGSDSLPDPDALDTVIGTQWGLYLALVAATLLLGTAEVLRDNTAQTILPDIVAAEHLERANGRMWSAEGVANTFVGPPLGALLIAAAFALPFVIDAASFFVAAALVALIPGTFRATRPEGVEPAHWRVEMREGVRWLWGHDLLRSMAIILGLMNAAAAATGAAFVLFAQEVLGLGPTLFAVVGMGSAVGGIVAGAVAAWLSQRLGSGTCLALTLGGVLVVVLDAFTSREWALRSVWLFEAAMYAGLWVAGRSRLTTARLERARIEATQGAPGTVGA